MQRLLQLSHASLRTPATAAQGQPQRASSCSRARCQQSSAVQAVLLTASRKQHLASVSSSLIGYLALSKFFLYVFEKILTVDTYALLPSQKQLVSTMEESTEDLRPRCAKTYRKLKRPVLFSPLPNPFSKRANSSYRFSPEQEQNSTKEKSEKRNTANST